jgi:hypothetical protein
MIVQLSPPSSSQRTSSLGSGVIRLRCPDEHPVMGRQRYRLVAQSSESVKIELVHLIDRYTPG